MPHLENGGSAFYAGNYEREWNIIFQFPQQFNLVHLVPSTFGTC